MYTLDLDLELSIDITHGWRCSYRYPMKYKPSDEEKKMLKRFPQLDILDKEYYKELLQGRRNRETPIER